MRSVRHGTTASGSFSAVPTIIRRAVALAAAGALHAAACRSGEPAGTAGQAVEQALSAIIATCGSAQGELKVKRKGQAYWEPIALGGILRAGDWLRTGGRASARVEFVKGGSLSLEENAVVIIDAPATAAAVAARVSVESGVVRGVLGAPPQGGAIAPLGIFAADGSEATLVAAAGGEPVKYRLTRSGRAITEIAVAQGEATLTVGASERVLAAGRAAELAGGVASEVVKLIAFPRSLAPRIDARVHCRPDLHVKLSWRPVAQATGYRVQIARDLSFREVAQAVDTDKTEHLFVPPGDGTYAWRVAAKDAASRFGEYGFARRIFCVKE